ncbi:MAG: hypothetical protein QG611_527, partial [Bacteroidota bacterium]|nr:hypothetical protein [Bacteroidota bacterium]
IFIDSTDMTNNFYDNTPTFQLPVKQLTVEGEISNPGKIDFSSLSRHSVIVKETLLDSTGSDRFTGAFRYDGYSLFDILENRIIKKVNSEEFNPVIDLYIEVENDKGDKIVLSWGEIYYPNNLHRILIAGGVSRIVPSKTKELWTLPLESKLVVAGDLITERNISSPVKITVRSYPGSFPTVKGMTPIYSQKIRLFKGKEIIGEVTTIPGTDKCVTFNTVFYGRGRGIHSTSPFTGYLLKDILIKEYPVTKENLRSGIMCITGQDGYRCAVSYSEIFNRNDQQEFLLIKTASGEDGGLFRMFAAGDFFSDRAVKSVNEIHLED